MYLQILRNFSVALKNFWQKIYNHFQIFLGLFGILPIFSLPTSEMERGY